MVHSLTAFVVVGAIAAAPSFAAGPPKDLLPPAGKAAGWREATASCRDLLAKLDADKPLVRAHLPNIRRYAEMLRRTDGFHWKSVTAVEYLEHLLTDLLAGRAPGRRYAGKQLAFPYWSETMGRIEAIWLHVPPAYDGSRRHQLFLYYKCGGGIHLKNGKAHGGYRPTAEAANRTDTFHAWSSLSIQVKGRMGAERELAEATAALAREFAIDPDRVFLSGWSDGGFTAVWLGSRWPHLVAGIAPVCANWQYTNVGEAGLWNVPMLCVDGWGDGGYNASQFRRWHALRTAGADVAGLWGHHGHQYKPYEDAAELGRIMAWAKTKRRDPWPKRVRYATWNLTWRRAYWVSIERMVEPWLAARIEAGVKEGNRIEVRTDNVAAYALALSERLVDPARPIAVVTNGKPSYSGPFRKELAVEVVRAPAGRFAKSGEMPGGIAAQIERSVYQTQPDGGLRIPGRRWLCVRPTGGDAKTRKLLADWAPRYAKDDTAVTEADLAGSNLFVFGGPAVNRLAARIAGELPVRFGEGRFTLARRVYDKPTHCVKLLHPNPLNPRRYVILYAFNEAAAFRANGFFGTKSESSWTFRTGDCVVMGIPRSRAKWRVSLSDEPFVEDHYVFGADWRPGGDQPLARLSAPLSRDQVLRLRAEAAREATGADAGIIFEHTPGWSRWREGLGPGEVTAHDLATIDGLPEYVATADVSGKQLSDLLGRAAASTVFADRRHPRYAAGRGLAVADIEAARTYRVAMGSRGLPSYGAEPKEMPPLHFFRTPEEFVAGGNTSLPVRNLRTTDIEMSAALVRHVAKRGTIQPRRSGFDLTRYVMNPQANDFGALDWLHLGADFPCTDPRNDRPLPYRWKLHLGLRRKADPLLAPPRADAEQFVEMDPAGGKALTARLDRTGWKLPVTAQVTMSSCCMAIVSDARWVKIDAKLSNAGRDDLTGLAALSPTAMQRVHGAIWPAPAKRGQDPRRFAGFRRTIGPRGKPPVHQAAAVLVLDDPAAGTKKLIAPGAGYNFGLVGLHRPLDLPAGGTATVRLWLLETTKADLDLETVLDAMGG